MLNSNVKSVEVIYFDFEMCFNRFLLAKLLLKLSCIGFDRKTYSWFPNFLCDRICQVLVNGAVNNEVLAVASGTVSGPLLFLLCVYNLLCCFIENIDVSIYDIDFWMMIEFRKSRRVVQSAVKPRAVTKWLLDNSASFSLALYAAHFCDFFQCRFPNNSENA